MTSPLRVTVAIPVKDGARYLAELLAALAAQQVDAELETLVIDSGSSDGSSEVARAAGVRVVEIAPEEFGHGRTRNLAFELTDSECVAFLTQDATPAGPDWLANLLAPLDRGARVGLSFGPHLPRADTATPIARELEEFFRSFSPDGQTRIDATVEPAEPRTAFFSNVDSAILRECWAEVRFRDVAYSEDQAFARDALAAGWRKAYAPGAGVLHAHDYPFTVFMRRYFDEYRGLRATTGHVEQFRPARVARTVARNALNDDRYAAEHGASTAERLVSGLGSLRHHVGRAAFAAAGSRADRLPARLERSLSLEGKSGRAGTEWRHVRAWKHGYEYVRESMSSAPAPLLPPSPHDGDKPIMHFAWIIPPFRRGSGGHMTIFTLLRELEARGHSHSIWLHDPGGQMYGGGSVARREIVDQFMPTRAGVFTDFADWQGADVAIATGWQTAYQLKLLGGCSLKAYLVQDYEPDFFPASSERIWAEQTYSLGYPAVAASPWLRDLLRSRYGAVAESFELGVELDVYRDLGREREPATVLYYARPTTPRRATELGLLALAELKRRRPEARVILFGDSTPPAAPFDYEFAGILDSAAMSDLYNRATAGLVLSLTNYSRMPKEMMACGLPVVDVDHPSVVSVFGDDERVITLAKPDPFSIADRLAELLDDGERRAQLARAARELVSTMTWEAGAIELEHHLRAALRRRWAEAVEQAVRESDDPAVASLDDSRGRLA
jgi:O-antigen biosynthesis protein